MAGRMTNEVGEGPKSLQSDNLSSVNCNLSFCIVLSRSDLSSISRCIL
jgi:hypothetical protein